MTYYFDEKGSRLHAIRKLLGSESYTAEAHDALRKLDAEVVWDVTLCVESPDFPLDLREAVHKKILEHSVEGQPIGSKYADYDEFVDQLDGIGTMLWELHTIFHELAERRIPLFSDDPRAPLRCQFSRGEEQRENIARAAGMLTPSATDEENGEALASVHST